MLINKIIDFCDNEYSSQNTEKVCHDCGHDSKCSGSCKQCLEQIHFPNKYPCGKKDYDCHNLINFYVCDYTYKYASEIWHVLKHCDSLKKIDNYHIMSIGCGGCPDLMAFESYLEEKKLSKSISYIRIDINKIWVPIHDQIKRCSSKNIKTRFKYVDAIEFFNENTVEATNVLVLQYVISHFYNTNQINKIQKFFEDLVNNIVLHKESSKPLIIIINDVNSNNRGRDYFIDLCEKLKNKNLKGAYTKFYFDYNIHNDYQRYGVKHNRNNILYTIPDKINKYEPWRKCSSAQLLIEIK